MRAVDVHLIVHGAARLVGIREARANLDALDGLDGHHRAGEARIEAAVPLDVRTEAERHAAREHFERPAERIARRHRRADALFHALFRVFVIAVQPVRIEQRVRAEDVRRVDVRRIDRDAADLRDVRDDRNAKHAQKCFADAADGHAHRRLPRTRALEDVADVLAGILLVAREVGMAGTRRRDGLASRIPERRHAIRPMLEIAVPDGKRDRPAERLAEAYAREDVDVVFLNLHAPAAPVPLLPPREIAVDARKVELEPGRKPLEDCRERRAVRFASRQKTQSTHSCHLLFCNMRFIV